MEVRDPIYGGVQITPGETPVVDHPFIQRLRNIRQVGFSHLPFPGASHSRYSHVIGVMHVAGQAFDHAYRDWVFSSPEVRERFRAVVRMAALCHDLGHAPFSHCTEFAMPHVSELGISWYRTAPDRRASHEDYTIAILQHTSLAHTIAASQPCTARHVACLISHEIGEDDDFFRDEGFNHRRLLSQIISSEMDADRLDYLVRDAYFCGVQYGKVDVPWIISNLSTHVAHGQVWLALRSPGLYAFEDFLVARHHMFLMVYYHHRSVINEEMLKRWVLEEGNSWRISGDLDDYLYTDDVSLTSELRRSSSEWAKRVTEHRAYRRVLELHGSVKEIDLTREIKTLQDAGLDTIHAASYGRLSRYGVARRSAPPIYVLDQLPNGPVRTVRKLSDASQIFQRYADARCIGRVYVAPEDRERARDILGLR